MKKWLNLIAAVLCLSIFASFWWWWNPYKSPVTNHGVAIGHEG